MKGSGEGEPFTLGARREGGETGGEGGGDKNGDPTEQGEEGVGGDSGDAGEMGDAGDSWTVCVLEMGGWNCSIVCFLLGRGCPVFGCHESSRLSWS